MRPISWDGATLNVIDQRMLPAKVTWIPISGWKDAFSAIREMKVRGAPLIGVVAAFGLALETKRIKGSSINAIKEEIRKIASILETARPTAVNLKWAVDRVMQAIQSEDSADGVRNRAIKEAEWIMQYEENTAKRLGEIGEKLIHDGDVVLTHCNAGSLATVEYGTALSPIRLAVKKGKQVRVIATETRPALQGARLTAFELMKDGIDTTLISDTMVGYVMSKGMVDLVMLGADRVLRQGYVINKIGTYQIAVLAKRHLIPFYAVFPWSSVDMLTEVGDVVIEQRSPREVEMIRGRRIAPKGIKIFNPAFDVTEPELVTALVTDRGIVYPPFEKGLEEADKKQYVSADMHI
ncbi:MAG: S-methyl-5-thioribose-1-phosphate isomerase [Conexivisphaerales archaeon]